MELSKKHTSPGNAWHSALMVEFCSQLLSSETGAPTSLPPQFTMIRPFGINLSFISNQVPHCPGQPKHIKYLFK